MLVPTVNMQPLSHFQTISLLYCHYLCFTVLSLSHFHTISLLYSISVLLHHFCLAVTLSLSRCLAVSVYGAAAEGLLNPFKARLSAVVKAVLQRTAAGKGRRETCALVDLVRVGDHSTRLNADPLIARDMLVSSLSLLTVTLTHTAHRHPHCLSPSPYLTLTLTLLNSHSHSQTFKCGCGS